MRYATDNMIKTLYYQQLKVSLLPSFFTIYVTIQASLEQNDSYNLEQVAMTHDWQSPFLMANKYHHTGIALLY